MFAKYDVTGRYARVVIVTDSHCHRSHCTRSTLRIRFRKARTKQRVNSYRALSQASPLSSYIYTYISQKSPSPSPPRSLSQSPSPSLFTNRGAITAHDLAQASHDLNGNYLPMTVQTLHHQVPFSPPRPHLNPNHDNRINLHTFPITNRHPSLDLSPSPLSSRLRLSTHSDAHSNCSHVARSRTGIRADT